MRLQAVCKVRTGFSCPTTSMKNTPKKLKLTSSHQIDGFQDLQRSDLFHYYGPFKGLRCLCCISSNAPDEMRPCMNQSSQEVVEPSVEILRQRRHRFVAVQPDERMQPSISITFNTMTTEKRVLHWLRRQMQMLQQPSQTVLPQQ